MNGQHSQDGTTEAVIEICASNADAYGGFAAPAAMLGQANPSLANPALVALTNAARSQLPTELVNAVSFSYSSDASTPTNFSSVKRCGCTSKIRTSREVFAPSKRRA